MLRTDSALSAKKYIEKKVKIGELQSHPNNSKNIWACLRDWRASEPSQHTPQNKVFFSLGFLRKNILENISRFGEIAAERGLVGAEGAGVRGAPRTATAVTEWAFRRDRGLGLGGPWVAGHRREN